MPFIDRYASNDMDFFKALPPINGDPAGTGYQWWDEAPNRKQICIKDLIHEVMNGAKANDVKWYRSNP